MNKNLLGLASILAASSLLLGGCASGNPGEGDSSTLDEATSSIAEDEKSDSSLNEENRDNSRLIEIAGGIANRLSGSCIEGEEVFLYAVDYDYYVTGGVIPYVPDSAILLAEVFLIGGYTLETEPSYSEEFQYYWACFSYDNGSIYVHVSAYEVGLNSFSHIEFSVYFPEEE